MDAQLLAQLEAYRAYLRILVAELARTVANTPDERLVRAALYAFSLQDDLLAKALADRIRKAGVL